MIYLIIFINLLPIAFIQGYLVSEIEEDDMVGNLLESIHAEVDTPKNCNRKNVRAEVASDEDTTSTTEFVEHQRRRPKQGGSRRFVNTTHHMWRTFVQWLRTAFFFIASPFVE